MFPNAEGYALGSIEGRVAIQCVFSFCISSPSLLCEIHLTPLEAVANIITPGISMTRTKSNTRPLNALFSLVLTNAVFRKNYSFRCHRKDQTPGGKDQTLVFSVNDIKFHPIYGTFATCGKMHRPILLGFGTASPLPSSPMQPYTVTLKRPCVRHACIHIPSSPSHRSVVFCGRTFVIRMTCCAYACDCFWLSHARIRRNCQFLGQRCPNADEE